MIAPGTPEEAEAQRRIAYWEAMIRHWNVDADNFRRAARGGGWASADLLDEAERTAAAIREAIVSADRVTDLLPGGHELRVDLMHIATALGALSESLSISIEALQPMLDDGAAGARLKYLAPHAQV